MIRVHIDRSAWSPRALVTVRPSFLAWLLFGVQQEEFYAYAATRLGWWDWSRWSSEDRLVPVSRRVGRVLDAELARVYAAAGAA